MSTPPNPPTVALFAGSFDPFHYGHLDLVNRARQIFTRVIIVALANPQKSTGRFRLNEREELIAESVKHLDRVTVTSSSKLLVDVVRDVGATVIIKGVRTSTDFDGEMQMAQINRELSGIETLFLPTAPAYSYLSSRFIRDIAHHGGDVSRFVSEPVNRRLTQRLNTPTTQQPNNSMT